MTAATKQKPATLSLFEIASEYRQMAARLRELDIDEQTVADTLEGAEGDLVDKLTATVAVALSMEAEAEQIDAYVIQRAQERAASLRRRGERLRSYVLDTMRGCQMPDAGQHDLRFRVRANPPRVIVDEGFSLAQYMRTPDPSPPPTPKPDLKAIGAALKADVPIPGARLETGYRLELL